jgi:uncharacterized protein
MGSKTALITGASSGLGVEFLKLYAQDGYDLILVARSKGRLEELAAEMKKAHKIETHVVTSDLSQPGAAGTLFDELTKRKLTVDALVNNAGYGDYGFFSETSLEKELGMMQLNMVSLVHLTKLCLKGMKKRGTGEILNVASTAAFQPGPLMAVYYATKAFVLSFSEALGNELGGSGIRVSVLCPGPTDTGFVKAAAMEDSKLFKQGGVMDAATVARAGYRGVKSGCAVVIPGLRNKMLAQSVRFFPRSLITSIVRRVQARASH